MRCLYRDIFVGVSVVSIILMNCQFQDCLAHALQNVVVMAADVVSAKLLCFVFK